MYTPGIFSLKLERRRVVLFSLACLDAERKFGTAMLEVIASVALGKKQRAL